MFKILHIYHSLLGWNANGNSSLNPWFDFMIKIVPYLSNHSQFRNEMKWNTDITSLQPLSFPVKFHIWKIFVFWKLVKDITAWHYIAHLPPLLSRYWDRIKENSIDASINNSYTRKVCFLHTFLHLSGVFPQENEFASCSSVFWIGNKTIRPVLTTISLKQAKQKTPNETKPTKTKTEKSPPKKNLIKKEKQTKWLTQKFCIKDGEK